MNKTPVCRFCGQYVFLQFENDEKRAEESAALMCDCPEAREYKKDKEIQTKAVERREKTLKEAHEEIIKIFGTKREEDVDYIVLPEKTLKHLEAVSILVYDRTIEKSSIDMPSGVKAIVKRTTKGSLQIERQDKSAQKIEI